MSPRILATGLALAVCLATAAPARADGPPGPIHATGVLSDGLAQWVADIPADWNGTLILYSHGYNPTPNNPARNAPDPQTAAALLARGYALVGSSYERSGWTMDTAANDQLETLTVFSQRFGVPDRTLALGTSMGGLITGQLAERRHTGIDGALATCGLMQGGVDLLNYQLDGAHAIAQLLVPDGNRVQLAGFDGSLAAVNASVQTMLAALAGAQTTPQGRARTALAAALYHLPRWAPGAPQPAPDDYLAQEQAQYQQFITALNFTYPARVDIENTVGGNPSWNIGVDYRALLPRADERRQVIALYRQAGLDLTADLDRLSRTAGIAPDRQALRRATAISELTGDLRVPMLSIHTTHDVLAPVQVEEDYAESVRHSGENALLRQAFVHRLGHCAFTPAELVASVQALEQRVRAGHWTPAVRPDRLDAAAERLNLGGAEFLEAYRPAEWLGDRGGALPGPH
ncbi:alpha/beta hydrolase [Actinophytocola sp.]|uniref:alpha/beta hydrolase n=1 Tax=Actinophytocola sp. TaxID=1872138 RepID=UPI002D7F79BC|nr:alpha/beta hydrolase [Actinophytocola sp.]HET9139173.1 alpha/beta hydrolase [Actinophytocola sp.]